MNDADSDDDSMPLSLAAELEIRQADINQQLDELNEKIEATIRSWSPKQASPLEEAA